MKNAITLIAAWICTLNVPISSDFIHKTSPAIGSVILDRPVHALTVITDYASFVLIEQSSQRHVRQRW